MEKSDDQKYEVKIVGKGLDVKETIDRSTALAVIQLVMGGAPVTPSAGNSVSAAPSIPNLPRVSPRSSLRAFIEQVGAKNISSQIVAIAAFLRDTEGKVDFTRDDVGSRFKNAGVAPPTNLPRDFKTAVSNQWIAEDPKISGTYFITNEGDQALADKFGGVRASTGRATRKKKTSSA